MKTIFISQIKGSLTGSFNELIKKEKLAGTYKEHVTIDVRHNVNGELRLALSPKGSAYFSIPPLKIVNKLSQIPGVSVDQKSDILIECSSNNNVVWIESVEQVPPPPPQNQKVTADTNDGETSAEFDLSLASFKELSQANLKKAQELFDAIFSGAYTFLATKPLAPLPTMSDTDRRILNILAALKSHGIIMYSQKGAAASENGLSLSLATDEEITSAIQTGIEKETAKRQRRKRTTESRDS